MNETAKLYFDHAYMVEENKILRQSAQHWKQMYEDLYKKYEKAVMDYDKLVMETVTRDLREIGE